MKHTTHILVPVLLVLPGCSTTPPIVVPSAWWRAFTLPNLPPGQVLNLIALDLIASAAAIAAAVVLILWGLHCNIPPRAAALCVILAVAAWTLKFLIVTYMWLIAPLAAGALVFFGITLYRANSHDVIDALRLRRKAAAAAANAITRAASGHTPGPTAPAASVPAGPGSPLRQTPTPTPQV